MAWQLTPPLEVRAELDAMGELELRGLMSEVKGWMDAGEWDDIAIARGICERGHSDDFSWWLLKEVRMRDLDEHETSSA